ncbi:MAG: phosphoribosylformimino-5-aminoimidazole carboxamide ribotide isomerase [Desulfosarcinaceae bacterium]
MRFRPCIDLHQGKVKQIVGQTLSDGGDASLQTNFEARQPAAWFAGQYRRDGLEGGHVIQLGPGNETAAREALAAWPGGLQIGGGISAQNAAQWLDAGAAAVIVTSWVFHGGMIDATRLNQLEKSVGRQRLVLDLSCRRRGGDYYIVTDRWQTFTREVIRPALLDDLASHCHEFLIHAVDVEGQCRGVEEPLLSLLGNWQGIPVTYAGGIHAWEDIRLIEQLGDGNIDFTVGSALDIFGGTGLVYADLALRYGGDKTSARTD